MLLSIIIPAYNVENYIEACLDSCLAQIGGTGRLGAEEAEIIVVDDGSTDRTPSLLSGYAERHACIHVMTQHNQGQSVARNLAIEAAKGDYIYMVDSDDRMLIPTAGGPSVLPLDAMRNHRYDIIGLQVYYQPEQGERRPWSHQMERWPFGQEYETASAFLASHNIEGLVYGYVFSRRLFDEHRELRFTPGIYHQDEELIFKIFTLAGRTVYHRGYTYLYYEHTGSSLNTRTAQRKRKLMDDYVTIMRNLVAWRDREDADATATADLQGVMHYKLSYLAMDMLRMLIRNAYEPTYIDEVIGELQTLGLYPLPWLNEGKFVAIKLLTAHPKLVTWWATHQALSRRIGF